MMAFFHVVGAEELIVGRDRRAASSRRETAPLG